MSTHKTGKYRNLVQQFGIFRLNTQQNSTSTPGIVAEYSSSGSTCYTGFIRGTNGQWYLFEGLSANPFTPEPSGIPRDTVDTVGTGFSLANLNLNNISTQNITASGDIQSNQNISGTLGVGGGNLRMTSNQLISTNTNGDINILPNGAGSIYLGSSSNEVLLPADPISQLGATTKQYVDNLLQGLTAKQECRVRTVVDLSSLSGGGIIVAGASETHTLTRGQNDPISADQSAFDNISLIAGDRVLVMLQGTGAGSATDNGIYVVTNAGSSSTPWVLTRANDFNQNQDAVNGAYTFVNQGAVWATTGWILTAANPINLETTNLTFVQFSQLGVVTGNQLDMTAGSFNLYRDKTSNLINFRALRLNNTVAGNTSAVLEGAQTTTAITINLDSQKITTVGALASGSIASGFGSISTANTITTTNTVTGSTIQTTGGNTSMTGGTLAFAAGNGNNAISITANTDDALSVKQGSTNFLQFRTSTGDQRVNVGRPLQLDTGLLRFAAATGSNSIAIPNNIANALNITDGVQTYMQVVSTTGAKQIQLNAATVISQHFEVAADSYMNGGFRDKITAVSAPTTLNNSHNVVDVTTGATNIAITLPAAAANSGRHYKIRKTDTGAGNVILTPTANDYLEGIQNDTLVIESQGDHAHVVSHGSAGWYIY